MRQLLRELHHENLVKIREVFLAHEYRDVWWAAWPLWRDGVWQMAAAAARLTP